MPFVLRQVTPVLLSKTGENGGSVLEDPRPSISNATLAACLRQLASLVGLAADIFRNCEEESDCLLKRSAALKTRLDRIQELVSKADSRTVAIPEGDLAAFSHDHKSNHFKSVQPTTSADGSQVPELKFICAETRPAPLQWLYEQAAPPVSTPLIRPSSLNGHLDDADYGRLMELGATLRRRRRLRSNVLEIETRRPASLAHLREWLTDDEALDDLGSTVAPDDNRRQRVDLHDHSALHRLPSPEEKARVAASQVFTAQVVRLDVTGSGFQRMTQFRRSLQHVEYDLAAAAAAAAHEQGQQSGRKRFTSKSGSGRSQKKGKKKKRRNTIACDGDRRDIQDALALTNTKSPLNKNDGEKTGSRSSLRQRLNLVHLLRTTSSSRQGGTTTASSGGAVTSSDISYDESDQTIQSITTTTGGTDATSHASSDLVVQVTSGNLVTATRTRSGAMMNTISRLRRLGTDHTFISGTAGPDVMQVQVHQSSEDDPAAAAGGATEQHYELIPSEKEFGTLGNSKPILRTGKIRVKECYDGGRSSSGNWSASGSSCSTRASLADSDRHHNIHQHHPSPLAIRHNNQPVKSSVAKQRSTSPEDADSVLSGDDCSATTTTSTKDGESHLAAGSDLDMETSSVYSCDAEGYYTSFQFDSGLKTLKEGQSDGSLHQHNNNNNNNRQQQQTTENNNRTGPLVENEYELFGKGSTTTTSSAGTVIFRPEGAPNNRNNSVKRSSQPPEPPPRNGSVSSRCHSNRNSSASMADSAGRTPSMDTIIKVDDNISNNKNQLMLSESESKEIADALDQLRSSDSNGHLHKNDEPEVQESRERIRMKTQIERIPAMCVVTPPPSDDESIRSSTSGASAPPPNSKTIETQIQSAFIQQQLRINVAELPILPASEETPIVIKAAVVKTPSDGLVALNQLPSEENSASAGLQPFSSNESSRSSSLERKRKGARVTLDADGKVVYSSDSLRRRKAHNNQQNPSTFEPGHESRKIDPNVNSAFRPAPIGFAAPETNVPAATKRTAIITEPLANKPLSPPPYRPAPSVVRTQPDGQQADNCAGSNSNSSSGSGSSPITAAINAPITRSDSYRMANVDSTDSSAFQRNDSYRRAQIQLDSSMRLGRLANNNNPHSAASGFVGVVGKNGVHHHMIPAGIPKTAGTGQFISGHLADNRKQQQQHQTQPMSYTIKSPMLVKQMSSPGFIQNPSASVNNRQHHLNGGRAQKMMPIDAGHHQHHLNGGRAQNVMPNVVAHLQHHQNGGRTQKMMPTDHHHQNNGRAQKMMPIDAGHPHYNRQASSPAVMMLTSSPVITNPNLLGRRTYGGPRVLVNPKNLPNSRSLNNSLDSSGSSIGLDVSRSKSVVPPSPVVRPPTSAQDRPSFYKANDSSSTSSASLVGYQSLSPPPRMSALPLAVPGDENQQHFRRNDVRYNSLPARFKHQPDYSKWLPSKRSSSSASKADNKVDPAEDSPEEGGFLEFNSNANQMMRRRSLSSASESPTPSLSSCSLDVSFTSSLNETLPSSSGNAWPATEPGLVVHSIGLVKRTTISDFKRKLLRTSLGSPPERKISAVELLKASKPMIRSPGESPVTKNPALENLIRRSVRVSYIANKLSQQRNHKTDVLSSTIAEGRSEEELAGCCDESNTSSSPVNSIASSSVRRQLSFTPGSSGCSTPIETSL